jgi:hypothetical protein
MWNIIEMPPQPFGECSICKRHTCGEYTDEEGEQRQKWLHTPIELDRGGNLVIGYQCVKSMTDQLGLTKEIVEVEKHIEPKDEHIVRLIRKLIDNQRIDADPLQADVDYINGLERPELKVYLSEQKVQFVAQWGDEKLKEAAIAHIRGATP